MCRWGRGECHTLNVFETTKTVGHEAGAFTFIRSWTKFQRASHFFCHGW